MNAKKVIGRILFLFTELGIICAAASAGHVSPDEGIVVPFFGERCVSALLIGYNPAFAEKQGCP
jgi:hypothetical protein